MSQQDKMTGKTRLAHPLTLYLPLPIFDILSDVIFHKSTQNVILERHEQLTDVFQDNTFRCRIG